MKNLCRFLVALCSISGVAPAASPIQLFVDATEAPRKIFHARLVIPVQPGELTLVYPQWIPGEHGPTGPIDNLAGLMFSADGVTIPWQRDEVNMFSFHLTVPSRVTSIEAKLDFLATAAASGFSSGASTGPNLAIVSWNALAIYPAGRSAADVIFAPSIKLPEGWKFATSLKEAGHEDHTTHFEPVTLEKMVDSPLLAGRYFKEIPLAEGVLPKHYLDIAADGPEDLYISQDEIDQLNNLVRETGALYQSRHYDVYHFLLTLSDSVAHFGLEHAESSDDRVEARNFLDDDLKLLNGELLPHEFTHSWNGKYRRPLGLATANFQQPMKGNLLWVYEGLTEYLGTVLTARSGIWTDDEFRDMLASIAAEMNARPGRTWRNLQDTDISAQILYDTSEQWDNWRRSVDYYSEGALIWLEVDTTIRKLSRGRRSLNDFGVRFLGQGGNTPPKILPYSADDIYAQLNSVEPYDWKHFLETRLTSNTPQAPLGGIVNGGYKLAYTDEANGFIRAEEARDRGVDAWYSLGFRTTDQTIRDVFIGSIADQAGLGPSMKLVAVNGRRATDELLHNALRESKTNAEPIELIVENAGFFKVVKLDYHLGERYPHLVRMADSPDYLGDILKPLAGKARKKVI